MARTRLAAALGLITLIVSTALPCLAAAPDAGAAPRAVVTGALALDVSGRVLDDRDGDGRPDVGDTVVWAFRVANRGDQVLHDLAVDDVAPGTVDCPATNLRPGAAAVCSTERPVRQADVDAGRLADSGTASATGPDGARSVSAVAAVTLDTAAAEPSLEVGSRTVVHDLDGDGRADIGESVSLLFTVTNSGNVTLAAVTLAQQPGVTLDCPQSVLAPAEAETCSYDFTVTPETLLYGFFFLVNASATAPDGSPVFSEDAEPSVPFDSSGLTPRIALGLSAAVTDEDGDGVAEVGESVALTYAVANRGRVDLDEVEVYSSLLDDVACPDQRLPVGGEVRCLGRYRLTAADVAAGTLEESATAVGTRTVLETHADATLSVPLVVVPSRAGLSATATLVDDGQGEEAANGTADPGEHVRWSVVVENTGTTTLRTPVVVDADLTARGVEVDCPAGPLAPGATVVCRAEPTEVTDADVARALGVGGDITTSATVRLSGPDGAAVVAGPAVGALEVTRRSRSLSLTGSGRWSDGDGDGAFDVGESVRFRYTVTNTGTLPFAAVSVEGSRSRRIACPVGRLLPGRSVGCVAEDRYRLTAADVAAYRVVDDATATGRDFAGGRVSSPTVTTTVQRVPAPAVALRLRAALTDVPGTGHRPGSADLGEPVYYTFRVANVGNVALHGVGVQGLNPSQAPVVAAVVCPTPTLNPGAVTYCRAARPYRVTQAEVDAGVLRADARVTATSVQGARVAARASDDLPTGQAQPRLTLTVSGVRSGAGAAPAPGDTVRWSYRVANPGPRTLTAVAVSDPSGPVVCSAAALRPGRTTRCVAVRDHVVTAAEARAGVATTRARATAVRPDGVVVRAPYAVGRAG